ncbi:hypothetical protein VTN31DRAFT_933 [Thermomyces dupontii]|uniref:uncharacterized protein n=1 Tax=Talaromyces thermophilus TaxID=28565 RepID=UPI0037428221
MAYQTMSSSNRGRDSAVSSEVEDTGDEFDSQHGMVPATKPAEVTGQSFTPRSLAVGLLIGSFIVFSNTYFGLQTGWMSLMTMPSSLIGFAIFKSLRNHLSFPFTPVENVLIQTVAGAVGTMPLGCGFVGVIPALEYLLRDGPDGPSGDGGTGEGGPLRVSFWKLVIWSLGVCLFGAIFAVPLRKEVIIREKLRFPSGTATALMIRVLHGGTAGDEKLADRRKIGDADGDEREVERQRLLTGESSDEVEARTIAVSGKHDQGRRRDWKANLRLLIGAFVVSAVYTLFSYFVPQVRDLPILGLTLAQDWLWTLNPSPAYVGQGIIMGPATSMHMLAGAVLGWGILSPLAKRKGWAPGPVSDWENGSKGWIVWVSLAIMMADAIINLGWLVVRTAGPWAIGSLRSLLNRALRGRSSCIEYSALGAHPTTAEDTEEDAPPKELISARTVMVLLPLTLALNVICMHIAFGSLITPELSTIATLLAVVLSVMGVRALGETDLNPVSGISKLTQLLFSLVTPPSLHTRRSAIVTNLLAGAVSEAGALQAGDMMQDLKTGHLLGASPKAQFYGQIIGSLCGAVLSTMVYRLYTHVYDVPGEQFQVPTAYVWIFTARLVTGQGLPRMAWTVSMIFGGIFVITTILRIIFNAGPKRTQGIVPYIPGGVAVAVGMFNVPSFTLARAIGGLIAWWWSRRRPAVQGQEDATSSVIIVLASGLILGEGVLSIVNLILASCGVPHL